MSAALGLIGLGVRAGRVVIGTAGVRAGLRRGDFVAVVVARDVSDRTRDKVVRLATARGVTTLVGPDASEIGRQLGRRPVQAVGVKDAELAAGIAAQLSR